MLVSDPELEKEVGKILSYGKPKRIGNIYHHEPTEGVFEWREFVVVVTKDNGQWHMSISHQSRDITYQELKKARYAFLPKNITAAQIFPPPDQFVNVHPYTFHIWQIKD